MNQTAATGEMQEGERYWAFISYSHRDRQWGEWLHRQLETFRVPKRLIGRPGPRGPVPARLFPTFRDREELPVSADLGRNIDEALRLSRYLVVICSPSAAQSRWVNEEILTFKKLGRSDRILALIVGGEPNASEGKAGFTPDQECFPEAMRFAIGADGQLSELRTEPIAADLRPGQDGKENAFLKLVAGIIGVNFDDLRQREHERKLRRLRMVVAAATALLMLFAALGIALYFQRNYAREQRNRAEVALQQVRQTLSRSDYLQAVEAVGKDISPDALAFLSRAVRTDPSNAAATELLLSSLADRTWLLPTGRPLLLGDEVGIAAFDRKGETLLISEGMDQWRILDCATGTVISRGKVGIAIVFGPIDANAVRVWDTRSGAPLGESIPIKEMILTVSFSPDGKTLLTTSGNAVREHDVATGAEVLPAIDHGHPAMCAAYASGGASIISAALFETFFWSRDTRAVQGDSLKHDVIPQSLALSPAGDKLAIALGDSSGRVFSLPGREVLGEPISHRSDITTFRFSANGLVLLSSSNDKTAALWAASTGARLAEPMRHEQPVIATAFNPDETAIFTVAGGLGKPAHLHRWSLVRPTPSTVNLAHEARVTTYAISPDGRRILTGCADGKAGIWDGRTHALVTGPISHDDEVRSCAFSPDGSTIATAAGSIVQVRDSISAQARFAPLSHGGIVSSVSFSPDGRHLLTASLDGTVLLWNAHDGARVGAAMPHEDAVVTAEFSPDGALILTASTDGTARLWHGGTGQSATQPLKHGSALTVAHFSPDGRRLVTGSKDGSVRVWDARTGHALTPPLRHDREITEAIFTADSAMIVTAAGEFGSQGSARVWKIDSASPLTDPMLHPDGVETVALHPDGDRLITGAFDGMLRVWGVQTGKPRSVPFPLGEPITQVRFSPLALQLVVASGNVVALREMGDPRPAAPEWLAVLAERVSGLRLNPLGLFEPTPERSIDALSRQLRTHEPRDGYERFGRWFVSGPAELPQ